MDPNSPIAIKTFDTDWQAELARNNLENADIFALVKPAAPKNVRAALIVRAQDAERAIAVLSDYEGPVNLEVEENPQP